MSKPQDKSVKSRLDKLEADQRRTKLIQDMSTALTTASDQWEEVCNVYTAAWDAAYKEYAEALGKVRSFKEQRAKREADAINACIGLAFVFLPLIGGELALTFAPILSTRAKLLSNTVNRKLQSSWTAFATQSPITSTAMAKIAEHSLEEAKAFANGVQTQIVQRLAPKIGEPEVPPAKTPKDALIDKLHLTREFMDKWVQSCSSWNLEEGWQAELVPVAHELFKGHPWIKTAPDMQATQNLRESLTKFIELALWFRWARTLDEPYWKRVDDWLNGEYKTSAEFQASQVKGRRFSMAVDILDFRPVRERLYKLHDHFYTHYMISLMDPESRGWGFPEVRVTLNMYSFIQLSKHSFSIALLQKLLPERKLGWDIEREIRKM